MIKRRVSPIALRLAAACLLLAAPLHIIHGEVIKVGAGAAGGALAGALGMRGCRG